MYKVLVSLWLDTTGRGYALGAEEDFDGVDADLVAHMVEAGQIMPLDQWTAPVSTPDAVAEVVEMHPHHVGAGKPGPDTWEGIWAKTGKAAPKSEEGD